MGEAASFGLQAGIDFFGSNAGFLGGATALQDNDTASDIFDSHPDHDQEASVDLQHASSAEPQDGLEPGQLQAGSAGGAVVDWKERYLEMKEQNMTLREKLEMLEQQLAKHTARAGGSISISDDDTSPHSKESAGADDAAGHSPAQQHSQPRDMSAS
jgi:hypothetical protein